MKEFLTYFVIFFTYSVLGWVMESTLVSIQSKKFVNRGFLIGPYCPIYGYGSLTIILYLNQYKENIVTVFLLGVVICSVLEYFTSYIMEKLFKTRWWDYSNRKFNLNGRICGENALLFGLGGVIIIYVIHPFLRTILSSLNETFLLVVTIFAFIIFTTDTIISLNIVKRFKNTISSLDTKKDSTQDFSRMVRETISKNHKVFQHRLLSAFPNVDLKKFSDLPNEIKDELKKTISKKMRK